MSAFKILIYFVSRYIHKTEYFVESQGTTSMPPIAFPPYFYFRCIRPNDTVMSLSLPTEKVVSKIEANLHFPC